MARVDCPRNAPARRSQLGARAVAHRSGGLPSLRVHGAALSVREAPPALRRPVQSYSTTPHQSECAAFGPPQTSDADGAPCVRYAGGTAPLAALQELAKSWETKPGWTLDEQEFAAFLSGP